MNDSTNIVADNNEKEDYRDNGGCIYNYYEIVRKEMRTCFMLDRKQPSQKNTTAFEQKKHKFYKIS